MLAEWINAFYLHSGDTGSRPEAEFLKIIEFRNRFRELIPNFGINSRWNRFHFPESIPRNILFLDVLSQIFMNSLIKIE